MRAALGGLRAVDICKKLLVVFRAWRWNSNAGTGPSFLIYHKKISSLQKHLQELLDGNSDAENIRKARLEPEKLIQKDEEFWHIRF